MSRFQISQKWISTAEPELGVGHIEAVEQRRVVVCFPVSEQRRTYTAEHAPLSRVQFNPGDSIESFEGNRLLVHKVLQNGGLFTYVNKEGIELSETDLREDLYFFNAQDRLFTGQFDANSWFHLRHQTLEHLAFISSSRARGLYGPRISLIPHQLYIGQEVANRFSPRVLLADEVGLGKTIEAGLILHQQLHTGRAQRALIIVPDALLFQWFVEMIRRFNLQFTILDEDRCQQIELDNRDAEGDDFNPFHAQQLAICALDIFTANSKRMEQAAAGDWDLLIIDEAHHLRWSIESPSVEYGIVEQITRNSRGVLLLTATPEQLGRSGHFARLRLLDPDRFYNYETFLREEEEYEPIAEQVNELLSADKNSRASARANLADMLSLHSEEDQDSQKFIDALLDQHGTGRVLFRNIRSSVSGFSKREVHFYPLEFSTDYLVPVKDPLLSLYPEIVCREMAATNGTGDSIASGQVWLTRDPRCDWLDGLLHELRGQKCLVICASAQTAIDLEEWLNKRKGHRTCVFHEGLDLISRDRAAAYFSDNNAGAQALICSEIGSEGRNFQFAHQLVLFDLPANPDLLEQRIGRLDRIGQQHDVHIHTPYLGGSPQELLKLWFHEGMNLFRASNPAAPSIYEELSNDFQQLLIECIATGQLPVSVSGFLQHTSRLNTEKNRVLSLGRDRLLELNSHDRKISGLLVDEIQRCAGGERLELFMFQVFEKYGLEVEPLDETISLVKPTESMMRHDVTSIETRGHYRFPELPEEGILITFDRDIALVREDVAFMTWENPIVIQAMELITSDVMGNSCLIAIKHPRLKRGTLLVETLHRIETVAPASLQIDKYLPPQLIRSLISVNGANIAHEISYDSFESIRIEIDQAALTKGLTSHMPAIRKMISAANTHSENETFKQIKTGLSAMNSTLQSEIGRLQQLARVNPNIRQEEIDYLHTIQADLAEYINSAIPRLDAVRLIIAT